MANFTLTFSGDVAKFKKFASVQAMRVIGAEIEKATAKNVAFVADQIEQSIKKKNFKPNAPLTVALKREDFPLKDTGDLIQQIEFELKNAFEGAVGFLRNTRTSHGGDLFKVIKVLEEGKEIKITPAMRRALFAKLKESGGSIPDSGGASSGQSKGVIRIPPRPFLRRVFESKRTRNRIFKNYERAVEIGLKRLGAL